MVRGHGRLRLCLFHLGWNLEPACGLRLTAVFSEANVSLGEQLRAVWRQAGGLAKRWEGGPRNSSRTRVSSGSDMEAGVVDLAKRRTLALPSILSPFGPGYGSGLNGIPKPTQANLRRFAETPVVRRAINAIKDRIVAMDWQVRVRRGAAAGEIGYAQRKLKALRRTLEEPNATDSFRTLLEQAIEDALTGGYGAIEMEATGDPARPAQLWPVDGATIRVNANWDGDPESARYEQVTSGQWSVVSDRKDGTGIAQGVPLRDDQLIYLRMNPRSFTPFGLGPLEVAFETVNQFLSAHRFAGKLAANSVVQYALWLNEATPSQHERMIRWWQDEIEGTGRVPLISTEQKPEVLRFAQGTDADLRLQWQQFLIRMVANAFGLPPLLLGLEGDVNRSTAAELADEAFRGAIEPLAKLIAEHITRDLFSKCIGWREFEFVFNDLSARDEDTELAIQVQLLAAGVYTVNEVRAMRGLGPIEGQGTGNRDRGTGGKVELPTVADLEG
jgi:HK97 family phage portal protein